MYFTTTILRKSIDKAQLLRYTYIKIKVRYPIKQKRNIIYTVNERWLIHIEKNHTQNNKKWRANNPQKAKAHSIVNEAIRTAKLVKPSKCSCCNLEKEVQAHHEDYEKPLQIIWLCSTCHSNLHKQKRIENGFQYKPIKQYVRKGTKYRGGSKPYKKDHRYIQAIELRQQGKTYQQIADITGISKSQIYKWLNNPGYK